MNKFLFCLIISVFISFSLHAGKNKKNIKQQTKSKIETVIIHSTNNPISDPEEFGFSHLKIWSDLNNRKRAAKERANTDQLNNALKAKKEENINLYEQLLREGAKQNCDDAMLHLGYLEEERENFEKAYAWYMISLCTKFLKNNKLTTIQTQNNNPYDRLSSITKHENLPQGYKNFWISFTSHIDKPKFNFNQRNITYCFINALYQLTNYNPTLSAFIAELCNWTNDKNYFCILGQVLADNYNLPEIGAYFLRLSKVDVALIHLQILINTGKITTDLNGKKFDSKDTYRVLSEITIQIKNPDVDQLTHLGHFILNDTISKLNGKIIPKNEKYEIAATYFRKAKTTSAFEQIGALIIDDKIQHDENNIQIDPNEKYEIAARNFRNAKTTSAFEKIGVLIIDDKIQHDENNIQIDPNQKYEIAARNFRKSGSPGSMINLGLLIFRKQIQQDENQKIVPKGQKYNIAASIFRKCINIQVAKHLIGYMIQFKLINEDEFGKTVPEDQRYEIASRLHIESVQDPTSYQDPVAFHCMALLIYHHDIDPKKGLQMLGYNEEFSVTKNEIFAELCRRSGTPEALSELALQIYKTPIDKDENNNHINENQNIKKSSNLFKQSSTSEAFFNLAIIKLNHAPIKSIEILKKCLSLFEKSFSLGFSKALEWCLSLKEEITALENQDNTFVLEENSPEFKEGKELDTISEDSEKTINSDNTNTSFSIKISKEDTNEHSSEQTNIDEENALSLEVRKKIKAAKKAEKIRKTKDLLKRKQKRFQLINHQLSQNQINDLLINVKKPQKNYKKNQIKWNKKTLDQLNALLSHEKDKVLLLIDDIKHGGTMGRPETLQGCNAISRRITQEHRLVYRLIENNIEILSCKGHYENM